MRIPSDADLRRALVQLREKVIVPANLGDRRKGFLRRAVIDLLVEHKPATRLSFERAVPKELREATTKEEIQRYLPAVLNILRQGLIDRVQDEIRWHGEYHDHGFIYPRLEEPPSPKSDD